MTIRDDAQAIIRAALAAANPDQAVRKALTSLPEVSGRLVLVAIGKAGWQMAKAAEAVLKDRISAGICITKYDHVRSEIPHVECLEAGHPVVDENSVLATRKAEELVKDLTTDDLVLFLVSGGGSALFEDPLIPLSELQAITRQLLDCGADITENNTIRKRLSKVKGGRFAKQCEPARIFAIILSDVIGDRLDVIASGPAAADASSTDDVMRIVRKYSLTVSDEVLNLLAQETPKQLSNVETHITGSVRQLCLAAEEEARALGYEPVFLTASLTCTAKEAGSFLAAIARDHHEDGRRIAVICGGETVVQITGNGLGGRNQELALSAAEGIAGLENVLVFSLGSDGTDGPTDAAGGITDGSTRNKLLDLGIRIPEVLERNDSYHALEQIGGLIMTGPTGTNVNDLSVLLVRE